MKVKDLRMALHNLRDTLEAQGHGTFSALDNALAPLDDLSIAEFCERVGQSALPKKSKRATSKAKAALNELGVARYLDELDKARDDNSVFEAIIKRAGADKTLKIEEATLLANRFTGETRKFKSKAAAYKAVLDRQITDKRSTTRGSQVSGLF